MSALFFDQLEPDSAQCEALSASDPQNPFATPAYLSAEQSFGSKAVLLGCRDNGRMVYGCLGFMRRGRLNHRLGIHSLPAVSGVFWDGLQRFMRREGVTLLDLQTFASVGALIPQLGKELGRQQRFEFIVPLEGSPEDLLQRMQLQHRQRVRKGVAAGLIVHKGSDCSLEEHVRLIGDSLQRRESRGETIEATTSTDLARPYLETGACRLFQAVIEGRVVSSMSVAYAPEGRYLHTSGSSPEGMKIGASQFLLHEIMKIAQSEGARVFNLGGTPDQTSGLAQYKKHFGADSIPSETAEFAVGGLLNRIVSRSLSELDRLKK